MGTCLLAGLFVRNCIQMFQQVALKHTVAFFVCLAFVIFTSSWRINLRIPQGRFWSLVFGATLLICVKIHCPDFTDPLLIILYVESTIVFINGVAEETTFIHCDVVNYFNLGIAI